MRHRSFKQHGRSTVAAVFPQVLVVFRAGRSRRLVSLFPLTSRGSRMREHMKEGRKEGKKEGRKEGRKEEKKEGGGKEKEEEENRRPEYS